VNQAEASAVGQLLVDEVDVVVIGADAAQTFRNCSHHLECHLEVGVAERNLDELTRLRVVINCQDADEA
jgi:hypothetical protein